MLHSDLIPEHECPGELMNVSDSQYPTELWCTVCGTDIGFEPDSDWITFVTPGMKSELPV